MTGIIVVFEGLPGCGKSIIAREALTRLEETILMPEVSEMAASRGSEVADRASIGTETWFLTQYYTRGAEADRLRNESKHVIMDRN
jgi:thymidylate kinase